MAHFHDWAKPTENACYIPDKPRTVRVLAFWYGGGHSNFTTHFLPGAKPRTVRVLAFWYGALKLHEAGGYQRRGGAERAKGRYWMRDT